MNTLFAAVRAIHYASAMLLFGELVFALAVAGPATRGIGAGGDEFDRRLVRIARWSVVAGVASGLAWFAIGAAVMSGMSIGQAMRRSVLELVLSRHEVRPRLGAALRAPRGVLRDVAGVAEIDEWLGPVANDDRHAGNGGTVSRRAGMDRARGRRPGKGRRSGDSVRCRASPRLGRVAGRVAGARVHAGRHASPWRGIPGYNPLLDARRDRGHAHHRERPRERLVPGRRCAGADRHRLRTIVAREARAVRGDAGPGDDQSVAPVRSSPKRGSRGAAPASAQCALRNRGWNRRRDDRRGAGGHGSRGSPGPGLAVRAHVESGGHCGLGMAAGDSGRGWRHRRHVGRYRTRGLPPGTHECPRGAACRSPEVRRAHAPIGCGARGSRGVRRAIGLAARRARPPHDVRVVTGALHDGEHRPRQRTLRGELPLVPWRRRSRRRSHRPLPSGQAGGPGSSIRRDIGTATSSGGSPTAFPKPRCRVLRRTCATWISGV